MTAAKGIRVIRKHLLQFHRNYSTKLTETATKTADTPATEAIKEPVLERWGRYWKNLYIDYKDVGVDVVKGCKERPIRAAVYFSILGTGAYLAKHNPDADSYREVLLEASNNVMMVGQAIRNPRAVQYLKSVEKSYNEGTVRRMSLGVVSFMWLDNYDQDCAHYKATCSYLKPRYLTFHERIVDVGFMDQWWILKDKMHDYDINVEEFTVPLPLTSYS